MTPKRWARVRATRAHGLRRGAWYAVVNDAKPGIVFLDVSKRNVAVDRSLLEFRDRPPDSWSVVVRNPEDIASQRAGAAHFNPTYGVCPQCRARSNLVAGASRTRCARCGGDFAIDWVNTC
jgi:hypothetical protein